jgi:hypothetical protein
MRILDEDLPGGENPQLVDTCAMLVVDNVYNELPVHVSPVV